MSSLFNCFSVDILDAQNVYQNVTQNVWYSVDSTSSKASSLFPLVIENVVIQFSKIPCSAELYLQKKCMGNAKNDQFNSKSNKVPFSHPDSQFMSHSPIGDRPLRESRRP